MAETRRDSEGWMDLLNQDRSSSSSDLDSVESDWEKEISNHGTVLHVKTLTTDHQLGENAHKQDRRGRKEKKVGKFSRLVGRKNKDRSGNIIQNESSDGDSSTYGPIKTFESFFEGTNPVELVDIHIRLAGKPANRREAASKVEDMLGIIPGQVEYGKDDGPYSSNRLIVAGFLTGGPAAKLEDKLKVGDWLRSIDGQQINMENVDSVLSRFSAGTKVKLTVQRAQQISQLVSEDDQLLTPPSILKIVTGQGPSPTDVENILKRLPYLAIYMSRESLSENCPELADVIYQFPNKHPAKLVQVRGLFLTLGHVLPDITGSRPVTTSLVIEDQLLHVGYAEEGEDLFVLALPSTKGSAKEVSCIVRDLVRVLRLRHGTLAKAFTDTKEMDRFFSVLFLDLLVNIQELAGLGKPLLDLERVRNPAPARLEEVIGCVQWLHLPDDVKFQIDDALSQLEAADFQEYSDEFYDEPREFSILGTCLFHKGYLLASHLPHPSLLDAYLLCKYSQILPLTRIQPVQRIVYWTELNYSHQAKSGEDSETRCFLVAVGLGNQVLCLILETGCGGVPAQTGVVRPDPFYVDQAIGTLEELLDMGIPGVCNKWLQLPNSPEVLNVDALWDALQAHKRLGPSTLEAGRDERIQGHQSGVVLKKTKNYEYAATDSPAGSIEDSVSLNQSQSDGNVSEFSEELRERPEAGESREEVKADQDKERTSYNSSPRSEDEEEISSFWELYRSGQKSKISYQQDQNLGDEEDVLEYQVTQLSVSPHNTIIHYIHLDIGEGVYLAPLSPPGGPLHSQVLENFRSACQIIHSCFEMTLHGKSVLSSPHESSTKQWLSKSLVAVKEQSILFHLRPADPQERKAPTPLSYWVSGRLYLNNSQPRECYVCHHDSAPQVMVELAFRLAFGVQL